MQEKTPHGRADRLVDTLLAWLAPPDRELEPGTTIYRARRRVTDHTSPAPRPSDRLPAPDAAPVPAPARCVVCGRSSRWLTPMREPHAVRGLSVVV